MHYQGPSTDDLDNIHALNRRFLESLPMAGDSICAGLSDRPLSESQQAHLGRAPFLLFSLREAEPDYWEYVLSGDAQLDLLASERPLNPQTRELQAAGLCFLWQLARYNPYAVRIVSGAPPSWCEQVAALPVVTLLRRTAQRTDMLVPRFRNQANVWQRLLKSGISADAKLRAMSHQSALQAMLTRVDSIDHAINREHLKVAAARLPTPGLKTGAAAPTKSKL